MRVAILGAGRIGSTFAYHLARKGHQVTLIARGQRLAELERDARITPVRGEPAAIEVAAALDPATPWDFLIVTVLAHQVDAVVPALKASAAKAILFMFNTFEPVARLRTEVGFERSAFGFPTVAAWFVDGKLESSVSGGGKGATVSDTAWATLFNEAGIPTVVESDMDSWLRSHVAIVIPLMAAACIVHRRGGGLGWGEAKQHAVAMDAMFGVVRGLGHAVIPRGVAVLSGLPLGIRTSLIWAMSRTSMMRSLGAFGPTEAIQLIDAVVAAAPGPTDAIRAIRPTP